MLKGIPVIIHIMVVIIGVAEKSVPTRENKRGVDGGRGKTRVFRIPESQYLFCLINQVAPLLITNVGCCLFVPDDLIRRFYPDTAMIRGQDQVDLLIRDLFEG